MKATVKRESVLEVENGKNDGGRKEPEVLEVGMANLSFRVGKREKRKGESHQTRLATLGLEEVRICRD